MIGTDPDPAPHDWQVQRLVRVGASKFSELANFGAWAMQVTYRDRVRMERAHVRAWPALHTAAIDGWHWRSSGGGSQRANSVSTIDFAGNDVNAAIEAVEARYRALGMPAQCR
jgi:hypothetical protein